MNSGNGNGNGVLDEGFILENGQTLGNKFGYNKSANKSAVEAQNTSVSENSQYPGIANYSNRNKFQINNTSGNNIGYYEILRKNEFLNNLGKRVTSNDFDLNSFRVAEGKYMYLYPFPAKDGEEQWFPYEVTKYGPIFFHPEEGSWVYGDLPLLENGTEIELKPVSEGGSKSSAKKSMAKKTPVKKSMAKRTPVKKSMAKRTPVKKSMAKKTPVKKSVAKKTPVKKSMAKRRTPVKKSMSNK